MEDSEQEHQDKNSNWCFSLLVDSGASGHYLDSDLISNLPNLLENYTIIENPMKIVGAEGHESYGIGEGIISVFAKDDAGNHREIRFQCITVHLFSTGTVQKKGASTIMSDNPRIELPGDRDTEPGCALTLQEEGTLYYLDVIIDVERVDMKHAFPFGRSDSVHLWHRRLAP